MLSTELRLIIECCRITLLRESDEALIDILETQSVDWLRVQKMFMFHQIRPMVYLALKDVESNKINADILNRLGNEVRMKSMYSLFFEKEIDRLLALFNQYNISVVPYKGNYWSKALYSTTFREGVDMDFLIEKPKVFEALDLLTADGYKIKNIAAYAQRQSNKELLELLMASERTELELAKEAPFNFVLQFDFHWEILTKPYTYGFDTAVLFTDKFTEQEKLLLLILMHNGKKESWTKMKYVCDLMLFVHKHGNDFKWKDFFIKLNHPPFQQSLLKGLALANLFLPVKTFTNIDLPIPKPDPLNIAFWEYATKYEYNTKARFMAFRLLFKHHSNLSESYYCFKQYLRYLSLPAPQERRLFVLPSSYSFLNLTSKVLSYFYYTVLQKIR